MWRKAAQICLFFLIVTTGGLVFWPTCPEPASQVATRYHARNRTRNFYASNARSMRGRAQHASRHSH